MIAALQNIFDQLRAWWGESFPSPVPLLDVPEIRDRDALFMRLEEHLKNHALASAARQETIQALTMDLSEAHQRVDQLQQRLTEQHRADWLANLQASTEVERLQALVVEKTPLSLGMFIEELDCELGRLRRIEPTIIPNGSDRDYARMKKTVRFQSNAGSIQRRVKALQAARERATALKMEHMSVKEIVGEMYRLRQSLPEIVDEEARGPLAAAILS